MRGKSVLLSGAMLKTLTAVMLVLLVACDGKKKDPKEDPPKPGSNVASGAPSIDAAAGSAGSAGSAAQDERCNNPCRFLADTPLAEADAKLQATCGMKLPEVSPKDCATWDYMRNCVYATAGYTFKKKQYQDVFGKQGWYKPRADFKEKDLSAVAMANVAELKKRAAECRRGDAVAESDRKIIEAWLAKARTGKADLPEIAVGDFPSAKEIADGIVANKDMFAAKKLKSMRYVDRANLRDEWTKPLEGKTIGKIIEADFSDSGSANCEDECGYGLWLTFVLDDKGKILGIEEGMAACPFVYLGDKLQGELVRNFNMPRREATQSLAVEAPCSGKVTYRIVEAKREITKLDELVLVVGDRVVLPETCGALCANDGQAHTLVQGDSLEVTFDIPAGACEQAYLRANGHYVPLR